MSINHKVWQNNEKITSIGLNQVARDADNTTDDIHPQYHSIIFKEEAGYPSMWMTHNQTDGHYSLVEQIYGMSRNIFGQYSRVFTSYKLGNDNKVELSCSFKNSNANVTCNYQIQVWQGNTLLSDDTVTVIDSTEVPYSKSVDISAIAIYTPITILCMMKTQNSIIYGAMQCQILNPYFRFTA